MDASTGNVNCPNCVAALYIVKSLNHNFVTHFVFSTPQIAGAGDSDLLKEDVVRELRSELQRCLVHLKTKRLKISELQEELRRSQSRAEQMQTQIQQAERTARDSEV